MAPAVLGQELPSLGEESQIAFSPSMERKVGETIMRDIRLHDPNYIDDPEVNGYLNRLGARLTSQLSETKQDFNFFALRDTTLNAFAMPGGYIGIHTGLIMSAQSESELASVLAHEISHVTQRHLARQQSLQQQAQLPILMSLALAILASHGHAELTQGALITGQAIGIQHQLNYSREFEREADRLGIHLLEKAEFDIRATSTFFERLQKYGRVYENNAPNYLRTHPLTTERIADMENRIHSRPYKQANDSMEFLLIRTKLRANDGTPQDALVEFETQLRDRKYSNEPSARYGYAIALARNQQLANAENEIKELRKLKVNSPMIESLAADLRKRQHDLSSTLKILTAASARYPQERNLAYALAESLLLSRQFGNALKFMKEDLLNHSTDLHMLELLARTHAAMDNQVQQHRIQAEIHTLNGRLSMAIEQLQMAQKIGQGDFFEQSQIDARLAELKARQTEELREKKNWH